ncbi:MAG: N-acetyltransferase [Candidatus Korobacteraceae bacterium]
MRNRLCKPDTAHVQFNLRSYRPTDFERLWQIDQLCFPQGISYTQMELSGFITRRNAITLVAEVEEPYSEREDRSVSGPQSRDGLQSRDSSAQFSKTAVDMQNIVGFIIAHAVRGKAGRILTLDIVPTARRLGLGSLLMDECEHRLRSFGCQQMYLETAVNNEPALRLYRKHGYQVLRTLPDYYATHSLDAFLMGKPL